MNKTTKATKLKKLKKEYKILIDKSTEKKLEAEIITKFIALVGIIRFIEERKVFLLEQISILESEIKTRKKGAK